MVYDENTTLVQGTRRTLNGIDVVAVDDDRKSCVDCPFHPLGSNECCAAPCTGITWVTASDYITFRLTS